MRCRSVSRLTAASRNSFSATRGRRERRSQQFARSMVRAIPTALGRPAGRTRKGSDCGVTRSLSRETPDTWGSGGFVMTAHLAAPSRDRDRCGYRPIPNPSGCRSRNLFRILQRFLGGLSPSKGRSRMRPPLFVVKRDRRRRSVRSGSLRRLVTRSYIRSRATSRTS